MLPDYFFEVAASSTGKYHPSYALGEGGLVRHTKAAVYIANDLLSLEMYGKFTDIEKDIIIATLILHDGKKHGDNGSKYTVTEHPVIIANWIKDTVELNSIMTQEYTKTLVGALSSHMGQWDYDYKTKKVVLPRPKTALQKFVHQCDYLASRKYLTFEFNDNYYNPDNYKTNNKEEKD